MRNIKLFIILVGSLILINCGYHVFVNITSSLLWDKNDTFITKSANDEKLIFIKPFENYASIEFDLKRYLHDNLSIKTVAAKSDEGKLILAYSTMGEPYNLYFEIISKNGIHKFNLGNLNQKEYPIIEISSEYYWIILSKGVIHRIHKSNLTSESFIIPVSRARYLIGTKGDLIYQRDDQLIEFFSQEKVLDIQKSSYILGWSTVDKSFFIDNDFSNSIFDITGNKIDSFIKPTYGLWDIIGTSNNFNLLTLNHYSGSLPFFDLGLFVNCINFCMNFDYGQYYLYDVKKKQLFELPVELKELPKGSTFNFYNDSSSIKELKFLEYIEFSE